MDKTSREDNSQSMEEIINLINETNEKFEEQERQLAKEIEKLENCRQQLDEKIQQNNDKIRKLSKQMKITLVIYYVVMMVCVCASFYMLYTAR